MIRGLKNLILEISTNLFLTSFYHTLSKLCLNLIYRKVTLNSCYSKIRHIFVSSSFYSYNNSHAINKIKSLKPWDNLCIAQMHIIMFNIVKHTKKLQIKFKQIKSSFQILPLLRPSQFYEEQNAHCSDKHHKQMHSK